MSMLQEEYNLTDEGLKQLLYDIRHPSMEAAIRHEKMYKTYLSNVDIEYDGESEVVEFKDLGQHRTEKPSKTRGNMVK